ncbi:MAG: hypothetical protein PGN16_12550 [Sphingomonas phyllosphaerae]
MIANPEFEDMLDDWLQVIDRNLALDGTALTTRPLDAACQFVRFAIKQIRIGDVESKPGKFLDYFASEWFKFIFARTSAWYRGRYGEALDGNSEREVAGCVLILDTPFVLQIPVVTHRPGKPGDTMWIHFPKEVEGDEDALTWLKKGPNVASLNRAEGMKARRLANEVAGAIRAIYTSLATIERTSDRVGEFGGAILPHLDRAAVQIARARPEDLKHAHWDMQMACELSLKLVAEQRAGSFEVTHDLYHLYDRIPGPPPFKRPFLSNIPNWQKMAEWRYGGGQHISIADGFSRYRSTLKIVAAAARVAKRELYIGGASIELKKPPFLHDNSELFVPRKLTERNQRDM